MPALICVDDLADEWVADNIAAVETYGLDTVYTF
jgi:hypothetical protein